MRSTSRLPFSDSSTMTLRASAGSGMRRTKPPLSSRSMRKLTVPDDRRATCTISCCDKAYGGAAPAERGKHLEIRLAHTILRKEALKLDLECMRKNRDSDDHGRRCYVEVRAFKLPFIDHAVDGVERCRHFCTSHFTSVRVIW